MKTRRIELRASPDFVKQLDELAVEMRCPVSSVIRRLVVAEHKRRFATAATRTASTTPREATPASRPLIPLEQADPGVRMFIELGLPPEDFGVAVPTGPTGFEVPGS